MVDEIGNAIDEARLQYALLNITNYQVRSTSKDCPIKMNYWKFLQAVGFYWVEQDKAYFIWVI